MNTNYLACEQKSDKNAKYENVCKYKHKSFTQKYWIIALNF